MTLPPDLAARCLELAGVTPKPKATRAADTLSPPAVLLTLWVPGLVPVSRANVRTHWAVTMRREREYSAQLWAVLRRMAGLRWRLPVSVTFHRVGAKVLDDDNLAGAYKKIRDVTAEWLGVDDGDTTAVSWAYTQEAVGTRSRHGTRVTVCEV